MEDDIEITPENFDQYFLDVRRHRPEKGLVMAKYTAIAEFVDGQHKRDIINLLKMDKAVAASQVMRKIHCAREPDCYRVCREMCEDLLSGMSEEQVEQKAYEYVFQAFYYAKREHVPTNDPHWETVTCLKFDKETKTFRSDIEL